MAASFILNAKMIDEIFVANDAFVAERLLQTYRASADKEAFVAALIGRLLVDSLRSTAKTT